MLRMYSSRDRISTLNLYYFILPKTHVECICSAKDSDISMYTQWCTDSAFEAGLPAVGQTHSWLNHKLNRTKLSAGTSTSRAPAQGPSWSKEGISLPKTLEKK